MKILLIGDMSGVHLALKLALEQKGHQVTLLSDGDVWRKRKTDLLFLPMITFKDKLKNYFPNLLLLNKLFKQQFDVVQLIHPSALSRVFFQKFKKFLMRKKFFVISCGDDIFNYNDNNFKDYYESLKEYDKEDRGFLKKESKHYALHKFLYENASGIIPSCYTYFNACISYCGDIKAKILPPIFLPYDVSKINDNNLFQQTADNLLFWHGLNRVGAKGSYYFSDAFNIAKNKYPECGFEINGRVPYDEFVKLMEKVNVYADQVFFADGYGYATVIALAEGKIVLGANGHEIADLLEIDYEVPIFRAPNNVDGICASIDYIIDNKDKLPEWSENAKRFVREFHDAAKIADQFIKVWVN